jgi:hypothetical protein
LHDSNFTLEIGIIIGTSEDKRNLGRGKEIQIREPVKQQIIALRQRVFPVPEAAIHSHNHGAAPHEVCVGPEETHCSASEKTEFSESRRVNIIRGRNLRPYEPYLEVRWGIEES